MSLVVSASGNLGSLRFVPLDCAVGTFGLATDLEGGEGSVAHEESFVVLGRPKKIAPLSKTGVSISSLLHLGPLLPFRDCPNHDAFIVAAHGGLKRSDKLPAKRLMSAYCDVANL
jgi:hypothetical protein